MTTGGVYTGDLRDVDALAGAAHAVFVRSSVAHGTIASIDTSEAEAMPGVLGVFTAANLGLAPDPSPWNPLVASTLLASDRVRYVGEPVAIVVAESVAEAVDAAESVFVDFDVLEAVVDPEASLAAETALFDGVAGNVAVDTIGFGMPDVTGDEFFGGCDVVVSGRLVNQRVAPCPLEHAVVGRDMDRRAAAPVAVVAERAPRPRASRPGQRRRAVRRAHHRPRCRRWLRRQDLAVPRRGHARPDRQGDRSPGALDGNT